MYRIRGFARYFLTLHKRFTFHLGIKPSLAIIDGELKVVRKYRGSLPICVGKYITDLLNGRDDIDNSMVFISSC